MITDLSRLARASVLCAWLLGCGGATTENEENTREKPEPAVVELCRVERNSVTSIAVDRESFYWTGLVEPGVFRVAREDKAVTKLASDQGADALSTANGLLFFLSFTDLQTDALQLSSLSTDGSGRLSIAQQSSNDLGSHLQAWHVPLDDTAVYWHARDPDSGFTKIYSKPIQGGTSEVLLEVEGRIWQTWLDQDELYYSDQRGIYALDLVSRRQTTVIEPAYQVRDPMVLDGALFFIGYPRNQPDRDGLYEIRGGLAQLKVAAELTLSQSRIVVDADRLYLVDNSVANGSSLVQIDPSTNVQRELQHFTEGAGSNIVSDAEHLVFATGTRLYRVRKDAGLVE